MSGISRFSQYAQARAAVATVNTNVAREMVEIVDITPLPYSTIYLKRDSSGKLIHTPLSFNASHEDRLQAELNADEVIKKVQATVKLADGTEMSFQINSDRISAPSDMPLMGFEALLKGKFVTPTAKQIESSVEKQKTTWEQANGKTFASITVAADKTKLVKEFKAKASVDYFNNGYLVVKLDSTPMEKLAAMKQQRVMQ